jgi:hypothetical protein
MQRRRDRRSRARKIGLVASVLALGTIGLVVLSGNYLPPAQAFFSICGCRCPHPYARGLLCVRSPWKDNRCDDNQS